MKQTTRERWRVGLRWLAALFFLVAGCGHFLATSLYVQIVPGYIPHALAAVYISGIAEIAGAFGLLVPPLRRAAGIGLILLLVAVFPANVNMALHPQRGPGHHLPDWILWARLPFQFIFIAWVWFASRTSHDGSEGPYRTCPSPLTTHL